MPTSKHPRSAMRVKPRKTTRLLLKPYELSDYQAWKTARQSALSQQNKWDVNVAADDLTYAKFRKFVALRDRWRKKDSFYEFAAFDLKSGDLVGAVMAMDVVRKIAQTAFLGYFVYNRFWGMGYGKEAVLATIDIAFRDLRLHRLEAGIEPQNRRSIMLARSLGLRKEGLKKRAVYLREGWRDLVMYSATCEDFGYKWRG